MIGSWWTIALIRLSLIMNYQVQNSGRARHSSKRVEAKTADTTSPGEKIPLLFVVEIQCQYVRAVRRLNLMIKIVVQFELFG